MGSRSIICLRLCFVTIVSPDFHLCKCSQSFAREWSMLHLFSIWLVFIYLFLYFAIMQGCVASMQMRIMIFVSWTTTITTNNNNNNNRLSRNFREDMRIR